MKRVTKISIVLAVAVLLLGAVALTAVLTFWPDPYARHFASALPPTAKLLHYQRSPAGFDVSYAFVFETADDQFLAQLVKEWSLTPMAPSPTSGPTSFVALRPPAWWLSKQGLRSLPERYKWIDLANEQYRSVWVDRAGGKLFAEYGQW